MTTLTFKSGIPAGRVGGVSSPKTVKPTGGANHRRLRQHCPESFLDVRDSCRQLLAKFSIQIQIDRHPPALFKKNRQLKAKRDRQPWKTRLRVSPIPNGRPKKIRPLPIQNKMSQWIPSNLPSLAEKLQFKPSGNRRPQRFGEKN